MVFSQLWSWGCYYSESRMLATSKGCKTEMRPDEIVLADILPRDKNAFDLVRLFAAVAVIFGHSFYIFPTGGYSEPVTQLIQKNYSGTLAVGVFFFLSGILVTGREVARFV